MRIVDRKFRLAAALACLSLLAGCTDQMRLDKANDVVAKADYCTTGDECMVVTPGLCGSPGEYPINKKELVPVMKAVNEYIANAPPCGITYELGPIKPIERFECVSQKCVPVRKGEGPNTDKSLKGY